MQEKNNTRTRLSHPDVVRYGVMQQINVLKDDGHFPCQHIR